MRQLTIRFAMVVAALAAVLAAFASPANAAPGSAGTQHGVQRISKPVSPQVSANTTLIPRETQTITAPGVHPNIPCPYEWLCIRDGRGKVYLYTECREVPFDGLGVGQYNNNQTPGTRALFYNQNHTQRWWSVAPGQGTMDWTPIWWVKPC
jgi:hypothetical protein